MTIFVPGGPARFKHQKRGLQKMISTGGVTALLFDPGMGKTAVVLDYAGLLALKSVEGEVRVLVVCPLVAVDTWVLQAEKFMSPQVGYWAEALAGSLLERAEALAARGGNPYPQPLTARRPVPPSGWIRTDVLGDGQHGAGCLRCGAFRAAVRASTVDRWWTNHLKERHPEFAPSARAKTYAPRALHYDKSILIGWRHPYDAPERLMSNTQGPDGIRGPRVVLEVINIDTLAYRTEFGSRTMADVMLGAVRRFAPDMIVVDESHKIKSATSHASQLLARVTKYVQRRVILTGTVTPAGPLDVFGQWRFLDPYAFGERKPDGSLAQATIADMRARYVVYGGWANQEIKGYTNLDHMKTVMARHAVVARKSEALDLPPTTDVELRVDLGPAERLAYAEMKKTLATTLISGGTASAQNRLVQMLRLRQITSGHLPEDGGPVRVLGTSKAEMIRSLVQDTLTGEKRIVIFALFSLEIKMLAALLSKGQGTEVMVIEGGTPNADRLEMRQRFGSDDPARIVMVAQIKTMSLAVNELVTANHAIFASLSQQRDDLEQARARLDRTGQTRPVTFWYALVPGTVDEVILQAHRDRTDLEDALLRHIASAG